MGDKRTRGILWTALAVLVCGLIVFPACQSREKAAEEMAEDIIEKATGGKAKVDIEGQSVKVKGPQGEEMSWGETAQWPGDMPSDVPKFGYGKVTGVVRTAEGDTKHWSVVLGEVEENGIERYTERLKTGGWQILINAQMADGAMITAEKGNLALTLTYNKTENAGSLHINAKAQ